jgi:uncharacterized protein YndB with AHSA1/START domain
MDLGTYLEYDGRPAVRFQRRYPCAVGRLWQAVTDPAELSHWFPAAVQMEARVGGTVVFSGDPHTEDRRGTVLVYDPPRRLAFTWGRNELHFELEALDGDASQLTLIDILESRDTAARQAAGWTVCLAELDKAVAGDVAEGPHSASAEPWLPWYETYVSAGVPSGAGVPGAPQPAD